MRDEVIYRCVNHSCARALPRKVNYCPYCGINQATALPRPSAPRAGSAQQAPGVEAMAAVAPGAAPSAAHSQAAQGAREQAAQAAQAQSAQQATQQGRGAAAAAAAAASAAWTSDATADTAAQASSPSASPPAPPPAAPHGKRSSTAPADPPPLRPIRLRWIALVLLALWMAWQITRPPAAQSGRDLAARVDKAVAMAAACKANEAQAELIALKDRATPAQLARLQAALDDADSGCRRAGRARAAGRVAPRAPVQSGQSVRNLLLDARGAMARGDYRAAADKMEVCVTMVDADTHDCSALKARAERLEADMRRCLARGSDWVNDSCQ